MKSFNAAHPEGDRLRLTETVELGWEHTVEGDYLNYTLDSEGRKVPRRYTVPASLTAADVMRASKALPGEVLERLVRGEFDLEVAVELVGAVIGQPLVETITNDQTVSSERLLGFLSWCLGLWGVAGAAPGEAVEADPFVPVSEG